MTPAMMMKRTAEEVMQPLPATIPLNSTAAEARERMREEDLPYLVVVAPETEKLLGMVLLNALERACESNGHDPAECPVVQHLKTDIDFCFVEEPIAEAIGREPDLASANTPAGRRTRVRRSLPVVVVDEQKVPVGFLER